MIAYNPAAGRYPSRILVERAGREFERYGWDVQLMPTQDAAHITQLAYQASLEKFDCFIIAGGDGSINRALPGLVGTETALGVLPAGTSNVFAQELGLPGLTWTRWLALTASAQRLARGEVKLVDVGLGNSGLFLLWAGIGLDGFVVHRLEPRRKWEKHFAVMQYAATVVWHASFWHGMQLSVELDDEVITNGHYLLAVVSNVHLYAGGMAELSPQARLDDGIMDLWLFDGETLGDTVQLAWELLSGSHIHSDRVRCIKFRQLSMKSDQTVYVQMDGEPVSGDGHVSITVKPRALRVLVPNDAPAGLFV
ncbi:MAG: diacylglycerol/lipid kinase family protein [Anaerolineales bacterium]